ncbi:MAG: hypothetical protein WBA23_19845 [Tunicatimonas sp.]|uniref:hypothetical protein n=1 Tax=Tunicatimonas sp. TaxID=1940096 RepID=UPI003C71F80D
MAKTTKTTAAKTTKAAAAKTTKAAPKKAASKAKSNGKATSPEVAAEKLAKSCQEAAAKFEKMDDSKYTEIKEKLDWCVGSYNYDKKADGLKEFGTKAVDLLKEAKKDKPRQVSQKLIDDLEKSLASL